MIHNVEDKTKKELVEIVKIQMEEYQALLKRAEAAERERDDKELEITALETLLSNLWPGNYKPMNIVVEELTEALRQQLNGANNEIAK